MKLDHNQLARRAEIALERKAKTKVKLMEVAYQLFADHGSDAPTIEQIIERAGVSKGTFYNYFESKDQLFAAVADEVAELVNDINKSMLSDISDPIVHIGLSFRTFLHFAMAERARASILLRTMPLVGPLNDEMRSLVFEEFREGIVSGAINAPSTEFAVDLGIGLMITTISRLLIDDGGDEYIDQAAEGLLIALGVPISEARRVARMTVDFSEYDNSLLIFEE